MFTKLWLWQPLMGAILQQENNASLEKIYARGIEVSDSYHVNSSLNQQFLMNQICGSRRMCWSLALLCLQEAAQDNIDQAASAHTKSSDGDVLSRLDGNSSDKDSASKEITSHKLQDIQREVFMKIMTTHQSWVQHVIDDASDLCKSLTPRDLVTAKKIFIGTYSPQKTTQESPVHTLLTVKFEENVWPTLRSRGWKVDEKSGVQRKYYSHGGQNYSSIAAVLNAIPKKHPELNPMVNSTISAVQALCKEDDSDVAQVDFDPKNITLSSLKDFLLQYAPLQLIVDRNKPGRIKLHHNTMIGRLSLLKQLHDAVQTADKDLPVDATAVKRNAALSKLIKIDPKSSSLPHPQWTCLHDAVLLRAVAKHGWIDRQSSVNAIANDKNVCWGPPFEVPDVSGEDNPSGSVEQPQGNPSSVLKYNKILTVARRAAAFLNSFKGELREGMTDSVFTELSEKLVKTYSLKNQDEEGVLLDVNEEHLKELILLDKASSEDCEELPSKKALTKRLKKILNALTGKASEAMEEADETQHDCVDTKAATVENHGFALIDQMERSNVLLAEMTRGLLKLTKKSNKQREFAQLIINEIDARIGDMSSFDGKGAPLDTMKKLKEHILVYFNNCKSAVRPAKNVLR